VRSIAERFGGVLHIAIGPNGQGLIVSLALPLTPMTAA
jgi:hypothetical protein